MPVVHLPTTTPPRFVSRQPARAELKSLTLCLRQGSHVADQSVTLIGPAQEAASIIREVGRAVENLAWRANFSLTMPAGFSPASSAQVEVGHLGRSPKLSGSAAIARHRLAMNRYSARITADAIASASSVQCKAWALHCLEVIRTRYLVARNNRPALVNVP